VHFWPGLVQYPQLSLQHISPAAHCVGPHLGPCFGGLMQNSSVQAIPGFLQ